MFARSLIIALLLALTGCAHGAGTAVKWTDRSFWSYVPSAAAAPLATYGEPNTGGGISLECFPSENTLQLIINDTAISEDRAVEVRVANVRFRTIESLDPPDGFAISRITIPLREAVLAQFARGARNLSIHSRGGVWSLPHATEPVRMVQDCIQLRSER